MLLAAAFVLINQFNGFMNIGGGSIIVAVLSIIFLVQCIADLFFAPIPVPLAVLYITFQAPLELPYIRPWTLILASILATIGLGILLPKKFKYRHFGEFRQSNYEDMHTKGNRQQIHTENLDNDNNPSISVNFGFVSRRLCSASLETVQLNSSFGALEIYFDQAELGPNGARVILNCSFGAVKLYVPRQWKVIDQLRCSMGGIDMDNRFATSAEDAPQLILTGSVSLGGVEVRCV